MPTKAPETAEIPDIQFVKGVGPKMVALYQKLGLRTALDLVRHYPRRYEDRRNLPTIRSLRPGVAVTLRGRITHVESRPTRGRIAPTKVTLSDGSGQIVLVWFNQPWIAKKMREVYGEILVYGMVKEGGHAYEIHNPDYEIVSEGEESENFGSIVPVYSLTEGLRQQSIRKAVANALIKVAPTLEDPLPAAFREHYKLAGLRWAMEQIHRPSDEHSREKAHRRLAFDEFLAIQLLMQMRRAQSKQEPGISFPIRSLTHPVGGGLFGPDIPWKPGETLWDEVHRMLPFELTRAQIRVISQIWEDMEQPLPMNRLVQGDVGSGKTAVAACAILAAVRCGYQAAMMAPTEILAEQHYFNLRNLFDPLGIEVALVLGKQTARERKRATDAVKSGTARIVVGTQALLSDTTEFAKLGLVIVDEQHRFGVRQRMALRQKSSLVPDVLVMTATPIPRTLAMTVYGDLDVSVIDELPPGRKPIKTHWKRASQRQSVYDAVREMVQQGRQAYFVCPAIVESEKLQTQAAEDLYYRLKNLVYPEFEVGLIHGQLKAAEKAEVMSKFRAGEHHILVATVVIEVGVDVPNASVMVIEDANRFGLSQLHQIRGRVGRGEHGSFCILIADAVNEVAQERLETMVRTSDGFQIAEADLKLRGPGDLLGTAQSGNIEFKIADLINDLKILQEAQDAAKRIIKMDPELSRKEHVGLAKAVREARSEEAWMTVS